MQTERYYVVVECNKCLVVWHQTAIDKIEYRQKSEVAAVLALKNRK